MKRIIAIILMLFVVGIADSPKAKKFEVVFTVKYNAITLEEAAKKEMVFRELYKDACIVDVKVKESSNVTGSLTAITIPSDITWHTLADDIGTGDITGTQIDGIAW